MDASPMTEERFATAKSAGAAPAIYAAHDMLEATVDRLQALISRLEDRLQPLTAPAGPENAVASSPVDRVPKSPLAESLENQASSVDHAGNRIARLLDRIEV